MYTDLLAARSTTLCWTFWSFWQQSSRHLETDLHITTTNTHVRHVKIVRHESQTLKRVTLAYTGTVFDTRTLICLITYNITKHWEPLYSLLITFSVQVETSKYRCLSGCAVAYVCRALSLISWSREHGFGHVSTTSGVDVPVLNNAKKTIDQYTKLCYRREDARCLVSVVVSFNSTITRAKSFIRPTWLQIYLCAL